MSTFIDFFKTSGPSATKVAPEKATKFYKKLRFQAFIRLQPVLCMPHITQCSQRPYH